MSPVPLDGSKQDEKVLKLLEKKTNCGNATVGDKKNNEVI